MGKLKINGTTIIQYAGANFNEGLRINRYSKDYWAMIHLGGALDSIEGSCDGGWLLASNASGNFVLTHNGSADNNGLVLQKNSATMTYKGNTILHSGNYTSYCAPASHTHSYLPLSGGTMSGAITMNTGTGIQMDYEGGKDTCWIYPKGASNFGIRYFEGNPDRMTFSASDNNNTTAGADLCINGNGDGTVTIRGKTILHAGNYSSYTVTKTGGGASGTWVIDITGTAAHANYINTVAGNEIRFHNATGLTAGGTLWLGWAWADGNKTVTKDWYIGNFSGGGLANIYASTFNGTLNGNATSATYVKDSYNGSNITITYGKSGQSSTSWLASWNGYELGAIQPSNITAGWASGASYSNSSNALASTGWGNTNFTYLQQSGDFYGNSGWSHYLISNHGDGSSYYNYVIALPFWSYPKYKRMSGGSESSWYNFYTTENVIIQSATPGAGFYGQIWFKI